jgi:Ni2+-binding GTPase involved in maturation of urease and hydrogenase
VHLRAPPESGKTSLLQLLGEMAKAKGMAVVYINCAVMRNIDQELTAAAGGTLIELISGEALRPGMAHVEVCNIRKCMSCIGVVA